MIAKIILRHKNMYFVFFPIFCNFIFDYFSGFPILMWEIEIGNVVWMWKAQHIVNKIAFFEGMTFVLCSTHEI